MASQELLESWAITLRHLAASRFYLPEELSREGQRIWDSMQKFLCYNELELGLDAAEELGEQENAPKKYWNELLLAAQNMNLVNHQQRYHIKLEQA